MPTTPNYGWDTPADTDYVTNGALAIRTMANDADATVYSVQTSLTADIDGVESSLTASKVAKAGDSMTGALVVPTITVAGKAIGLLADGSGTNIIQFLNPAGTVEYGTYVMAGSEFIFLNMATNGNSLSMNAFGETTRTHASEIRPIPFAMECGTATVSANSSVTVSLNSGRFLQAPIIMVTPNSVTSSAITYHAGNSTTSSFKIYNTSASTRDFYWQAIQMTYATSAG
jgi:hypothetical protein